MKAAGVADEDSGNEVEIGGIAGDDQSSESDLVHASRFRWWHPAAENGAGETMEDG
jgi:hypothetical protein